MLVQGPLTTFVATAESGTAYSQQTPLTPKIMSLNYDQFTTTNLLLAPQGLFQPLEPLLRQETIPIKSLSQINLDLYTTLPIQTTASHTTPFPVMEAMTVTGANGNQTEALVLDFTKHESSSTTFTIQITSPLSRVDAPFSYGIYHTLSLPLIHYPDQNITLLSESYNFSHSLYQQRLATQQALCRNYFLQTVNHIAPTLTKYMALISTLPMAFNQASAYFGHLDLYAMCSALFSKNPATTPATKTVPQLIFSTGGGGGAGGPTTTTSTTSSFGRHNNAGGSGSAGSGYYSHQQPQQPSPNDVSKGIVQLSSLTTQKEQQQVLTKIYNPYHTIIPYTSQHSTHYPSSWILPFYQHDNAFYSYQNVGRSFSTLQPFIASIYSRTIFSYLLSSPSHLGWVGQCFDRWGKAKLMNGQQNQQQQQHPVATTLWLILAQRDSSIQMDPTRDPPPQQPQPTPKGQSNIQQQLPPPSTTHSKAVQWSQLSPQSNMDQYLDLVNHPLYTENLSKRSPQELLIHFIPHVVQFEARQQQQQQQLQGQQQQQGMFGHQGQYQQQQSTFIGHNNTNKPHQQLFGTKANTAATTTDTYFDPESNPSVQLAVQTMGRLLPQHPQQQQPQGPMSVSHMTVQAIGDRFAAQCVHHVLGELLLGMWKLPM